MVKDVVKSECRMIVMWSCFQVVEAHENRSAGREKYTKCGEETLQQPYVVNYSKRDDKHVVRQSREHLHPSSAGVVL